MKRVFRIMALGLALAGVVCWIILGAHRGWSQTTVPVRIVDEVTGLEAVEYRRQFVPGLDFLGGTLAGAGALAVVSFFFRKQPITSQI
jgi:hypothetical protein